MSTMSVKRVARTLMFFVGSAALADPPYPPSNVMLQFTCLWVAPPGRQNDAGGTRGLVLRTERVIGGRSATHHIMLPGSRSIEMQERLATPDECTALRQNEVSWVRQRNGSTTAEFCITEVPGYLGNVTVRISVPPLHTDQDRVLARSIAFISSCRVGQEESQFLQGGTFIDGRSLLVPPIPQ
jgi:hypothetical protein